MTVEQLMHEFVDVYGKSKWTYSTYTCNMQRVRNYILPLIGDISIEDIDTMMIERYYVRLLSYPSKSRQTKYCSPSVIREVHKLLNEAFARAVVWKLISYNPITDAIRPKEHPHKRDVWNIEELKHAMDVCEDDLLRLAINLAFATTLRESEILGLQWSKIFLDSDTPFLSVEQIIQRVEKEAIGALNERNADIYMIFPQIANRSSNSMLVLKKPKTDSSIRTVYIPKTVCDMLRARKNTIEQNKIVYGNKYKDYDLVICNDDGTPIEDKRLRVLFNRFIDKNSLRKVCFHSLRHTSITYKLRVSNGNIKAVQGDSGHAKADMITEIYSHVQDEDRVCNANIMERDFYKNIKIDTINEVNIDNLQNY